MSLRFELDRRARRPEGISSTGVGKKPRSGQALVEFALILPVFLLLAMIVLDLGRVFYTYEAIANAAREGARYCALNAHTTSNPSQGTTTRVVGELNGTVSNVSVVAPACDTTVPAGQPVTVTVTTTFTPITPVIARVVGNSITLHASATMVMWQ